VFRVNKHSSVVSLPLDLYNCCCSETFRDEIIRFDSLSDVGRWRSFLPATVLTGCFKVALAAGIITY
jgi:hypothetical protein